MYENFKTRAQAVSAEVHRFPTKGRALEFILEFLRNEGVADLSPAYAVWANSPFLNEMDRTGLAKQVPGLRFDVNRELAAEAKVGISEMDWAVANTGTLVQDSSSSEQRLVSSLPPIHIALVATENILADMPSLLKRISIAKSNYISMITGPSRTADIERVLTIGVHGPGRLIIIFVDELGGLN